MAISKTTTHTSNHSRKSKGRAYWQRHIEAWSKSGLAQAEYCRQHNLSKSAFYNWNCKLKANDLPKVTSDFLPVKRQTPNDNTPEAMHDALSLTLPNGCTVNLPLQADPAFVLPWLERLSQLQ